MGPAVGQAGDSVPKWPWLLHHTHPLLSCPTEFQPSETEVGPATVEGQSLQGSCPHGREATEKEASWSFCGRCQRGILPPWTCWWTCGDLLTSLGHPTEGRPRAEDAHTVGRTRERQASGECRCWVQPTVVPSCLWGSKKCGPTNSFPLGPSEPAILLLTK